jgi:DNA repair exonuclease SbcCD ATPase subunit
VFVQTRSHGRERAPFYVCSSFHHRGSTVCGNNQALPLARIDAEALNAAREDLLHPLVIERTFTKLRRRLEDRPAVSADRRAELSSEADRLRHELSRLSAALASGETLPSVLDAIRERERRREVIAAELGNLESRSEAAIVQLDAAWPEIQARMAEWRRMLSEGTTRARQMLRVLLDGRLVFTPRREWGKWKSQAGPTMGGSSRV